MRHGWIMMWCLVGVISPVMADERAMLRVRADEARRQQVIERVYGSVLAIFGQDPQEGGGSGVLISADGQALTNFHVVAAAGWQGVAGLPDGRLLPWRLIGVDPGGDLALIQLPSETALPAAELGDSRSLRPGMWVMAMGNGFNLAGDYQPGVSLGVVSGVERFQDGEGGSNLLRYGQCIQVDAAINPGNSGGPLFDMQGKVIGIVGRASFAERGRVNVGLGYAISVAQVLHFLPRLREGGLVHHGRVGATFTDLDGKVICKALERDSQLAHAGLQRGDQLMRLGGVEVRSADHYTGLLSIYPAGAVVEMVWNHQGQWRSSKIILEKEAYDTKALAQQGWPPPSEAWAVPVTPVAARDARARPIDWVAVDSPWHDAIASATGKVVKLQGGAIGMEVGYASGMLIGPQGEILTTLGAMTTSDQVTVTLADGSQHRAKLAKRHDALQAVLLRIPVETPDHFDLSDKPKTLGSGDWVMAVSHAFGVAQGDEPASVNLGVVSWQGRLDLRRRMIDSLYSGPVLVVDAGISNPGNAGGAVVDMQGRLVGMVGKMVEHQHTGTRLNYAIPVGALTAWLHGDALAPSPSDGHVVASPTIAETAVDLGIRLFTQGGESAPAYVERVLRQSPAAKAGLLKEDMILSIGGDRVSDVRSAQKILAQPRRERTLALVIRRGEQVLTLEVFIP